MKKLLSLLLVVLMFASPAYADNMLKTNPWPGVTSADCVLDLNFEDMTGAETTTASYKIFADYCAGNGTLYYSAPSNGRPVHSRTGVMSTVNAGVPQLTYGEYDDTGFVYRPGLLMHGNVTNLALYSEVMSNAAWVRADGADAGTDPDLSITDNTHDWVNGNTVAETIKCETTLGTILQTVTAASNEFVYSVYLKRKTGSGTIEITTDGGTNWHQCVLSSWAWRRFWITTAGVTNPVFGIRMTTVNDEIYACGNQITTGVPGPYIPTTSAAVGNNMSFLEINGKNVKSSEATIFLKLSPMFKPDVPASATYNLLTTSSSQRKIVFEAASDSIKFYPNSTDSSSRGITYTTTWDFYEPLKFAMRCTTVESPYTSLYTGNGTLFGSDTTTFTAIANNVGSIWLNQNIPTATTAVGAGQAIYHRLIIFNKPLATEEIKHVMQNI